MGKSWSLHVPPIWSFPFYGSFPLNHDYGRKYEKILSLKLTVRSWNWAIPKGKDHRLQPSMASGAMLIGILISWVYKPLLLGWFSHPIWKCHGSWSTRSHIWKSCHSEELRISPGSLATSPALLQKAMSNPQCHHPTMSQVEQPWKEWHEVHERCHFFGAK